MQTNHDHECEIRSSLSPSELALILVRGLDEEHRPQVMGRWKHLTGSVVGDKVTARVVKPLLGIGVHSPVALYEYVGQIEAMDNGGVRLAGEIRPRTDRDGLGLTSMKDAAGSWNYVIGGLFGFGLGWVAAGPLGALALSAAMVSVNIGLARYANRRTLAAERDAIMTALQEIVSAGEASLAQGTRR